MITPEELPHGAPTPEDFSSDVETSLVVCALIAELDRLDGKNVFVTLVNKETYVGSLEIIGNKILRIGHHQEEISINEVSSIREV